MTTTHLRSSLAVCIGLLFAACRAPQAESKTDLPVVRTEPVTLSTSESGARYSGVLRPDKQVQLDFKVAGYVRKIAHAREAQSRALQEGDRVRAGDVLAWVDSADYAAKLEEARAAVSEARAAESQAARDETRWKALVADDARPRAELERYESQLAMSTARRSRAEAVVHEAELALGDCTLRAPFGGVVLSRLVEEGALVTPRTPGFVLADTSTIKVGFGVTDAVAMALHVGDRATVEIAALSRTENASVTRVAPAADPKSRLFDVEVSIANADGSLKPGVVATVSLSARDESRNGAARVPLASLVRGPDTGARTAVFVVQGSDPIARLRAVEVLGVAGASALVSGLTEGDRVATLGASLLHDNEHVRLVP